MRYVPVDLSAIKTSFPALSQAASAIHARSSRSGLLRSLTALVLGIALSGSSALAQVATAKISGSVADSTGAIVPDAKISLVEESTGLRTEAQSGKDGGFELTSVAVGRYNLTVMAQGFANYQLNDIPVAVNQALTLPVKLAPAGQLITVNVQASQVAVDTQTTSVQSQLNEAQVSQLPLNGRNPADLLFTVAGASNLTATNGTITQADITVNSPNNNYPGETAVAIHGSRSGGVYFALDGGTNTDPFQVLGGPFPNPDATGEFSVQTATYGARYVSAPGGAVNIVTRSGTNQLHGSAFEFIRNGAVNARNWFSGGAPDNLKRNQFGFAAGGPIMKDRWFLFGSYQGTRIVTQSVAAYYLPTAAERNGTFPEFLVDPATFFTPLPYDPATNTTQIPGNLLSPVNQNYLKLIPTPTTADGSYDAITPSRSHENQYVARTDYHWGNHTSFLRYFGAFSTVPTYGDPAVNLLTAGFGTKSQFQNATLGDTWAHGNLINDFRVTYLYTDLKQSDAANVPSYAGLGANITPSDVRTAFALIAGAFSVSEGALGSNPRHNVDIADNVDIVKGRHSLSFGTEIQQLHLKFVSTSGQDPLAFYFGLSGNSLADFVLGAPTLLIASDGQFSKFTGTLYGFHAQDQFKVGSRTIVTAGVRWDPYLPFTADNKGLNCYISGQQTKVFPNAPLGLDFPGDPGCTSSATHHRLGLVQPRIGLAQQLDSTGKTSFRAGYGIYTMQVPLGALTAFSNAFPFLRTYSLTLPGTIDEPWARNPGGDPFAATGYRLGVAPPADSTFPIQPSIASLASNFTPGDIQQWSLSLQRAITSQDLVELAYVGTKGTHMILNYNVNTPLLAPNASVNNEQARRPDQGFTDIYQIRSDGVSNYHGLTLSYRHNQGRSLFIDSEFNYGKALDDGSIPGSSLPGEAVPQASLFHGFHYAPSDFDQRLTWRTTAVWNTPKLENMNRGLRLLLGDWSVNGIYSMESGFPFTATSGADNSYTGLNDDYADYVPGQKKYLSNPTNKTVYLNPSAFTVNAPGTFGNVGRNSLSSPDYIDLDLGIMKHIPIRDAIGLTFRFESFNTVNHPNFLPPAASVTNPQSFGLLTTAKDPRILQISGRITF